MSKVILKISFKHPNMKKTPERNAEHLNYIASRPGVDKSLTESDLQNELRKEIKNDPLDNENYAKYIHQRPHSHGLFGPDGVADLLEVRKEIMNARGYVWRCIISVREEDAKKVGYLEKSAWQDMLRNKVPDMAREMKIGIDNLKWVAAVHMEKGHPHAHVLIWEKVPEIRTGVISKKKLDNMRKLLADEIFAEERLLLLQEKNIMRDLIRDLAKNNISDAARLIRDVNATSEEIRLIMNDVNITSIAPKLYTDDELWLADQLSKLATIMPGKGRIALKFMPQDVKEFVYSIADMILSKPEFAANLERCLKAVEEMTKIYTNQDVAIQKARSNTYKDIRDRICQIILKGAVESQKLSMFYVDDELAQKAVDFIKSMNNKLSLVPEQTNVLHQVSIVLAKTGLDDKTILRALNSLVSKDDVNFTDDHLDGIIKDARSDLSEGNTPNILHTPKGYDYFFSCMKLAGVSDTEAFSKLKDIALQDSLVLESQLKTLCFDGLMEYNGKQYFLTEKGIDEFLKVKVFDRVEKEIMNMFTSGSEGARSLSFDDFIGNKNIFASIYEKDPEEVKIKRFDARIREVFGDDNCISLSELEQKIYDKYNVGEHSNNADQAEQEFEILKNRINKLTLYGYIMFNKETGRYSFTDESLEYFKFDKEKDTYVLSDVAYEKFDISKEFEFTRYDASVTLSYIDKSDGGILTSEQLKNMLNSEITNVDALSYYEKFTELIEKGPTELINRYIAIDEEGNITSTEEGKHLSRDMNKLFKYFKDAPFSISEDSIRGLCGSTVEYDSLVRLLKMYYDKGHVEKDLDSGLYKINSTITDISKLVYQVYKAGGSINKNELKSVLLKTVPNREAEKQYNYLCWRLNNLKSAGYLEGSSNEYRLSAKGIEYRMDLLVRQRGLLKKTLNYLVDLGLLSQNGDMYEVTEKYHNLAQNVLSSQDGRSKSITNFPDYICKIIDSTQNKIDVEKILRTNLSIITGKYINGNYENIKTDYSSIRSACGVPDMVHDTLSKLATILLVSGVDPTEARETLTQWNIRSGSNIDDLKLSEIIEKTFDAVKVNNLWGKTTLIPYKEWKELFVSLGVNQDYIPKWIFKSYNWLHMRNYLGMSVVNIIWKSAWKVLERERMKTINLAEMMKKRQIQKQAESQSKAAAKEAIRKSKDRGGYDIDDA